MVAWSRTSLIPSAVNMMEKLREDYEDAAGVLEVLDDHKNTCGKKGGRNILRYLNVTSRIKSTVFRLTSDAIEPDVNSVYFVYL